MVLRERNEQGEGAPCMNAYQISPLATKYLNYDMIKLHTHLPPFPDMRSHLLFLFLQKDSSDVRTLELFTLVTALVQMGIDTHELVSSSNDVKEKSVARSRQLKVLAGDYFSARFYELLAQAGQVDMIKQLSYSICEVNQLKMNMYQFIKKLKLTADHYLQLMTDIHSCIYISFVNHIPKHSQSVWQEVLQQFTRCEILFEELTRQNHHESMPKNWKYWQLRSQVSKVEKKQMDHIEFGPSGFHILLHKYDIQTTLVKIFTEQVAQLNRTLQQGELHPIALELQKIAQPFFQFAQQTQVYK
jgi:heptaprenyl diphosphate synthase